MRTDCPAHFPLAGNATELLNYAIQLKISKFLGSRFMLPDLTFATFFLSYYPHQNEEPVEAEDLRKYYTFPFYSEVCLDFPHDFPFSPIIYFSLVHFSLGFQDAAEMTDQAKSQPS
jgi:hypothetical protein